MEKRSESLRNNNSIAEAQAIENFVQVNDFITELSRYLIPPFRWDLLFQEKCIAKTP